MAAKEKADWIQIEGDYRSGKKSLRDIAGEHGISEGAIRKKAKAGCWLRDPSGMKRERVKSILAGQGTLQGTQYAMRTLEEESAKDVEDMDTGLGVARACLLKLLVLVGGCADPRDVKCVAEANKIAVETIRRIRGLDDAVTVVDSPTTVRLCALE